MTGMKVSPQEVVIDVWPTPAEHELIEHAVTMLTYKDRDSNSPINLHDHMRETFQEYLKDAPFISVGLIPITLNEFKAMSLAAALGYILENRHCAGKEVELAKQTADRLYDTALIFSIVYTDDSVRQWMSGFEDKIDMKSLEL